ncbi:Centrosomal protein [Tetrabaena socialis]|uniref:Centrosomal protein n=1 Tax=Tetrabaena socialis TaxID=47790 RepID=A0A2J8ACR7_9CHLO|nr:Centrosomal protein [Tetrabaena socialis]|eukprot:PNH10303.1 Centrosomal protein [Tetrabaena socialis]
MAMASGDGDGTPRTPDRTYILSITILDGRAFGPDVHAVLCAATFAGETKLTPYSVGRDAHVWNTELQWRVTLDQFRRLTSLGQKDCKVVLFNKDGTKEGTKVGWFVVDIRAAKLQAQYKKDEGVWMTLLGAKRGEAPQVCVLAWFYEDRPGAVSPPGPKRSPSRPRATRRQAPTQAAGPSGDGPDAQPEGAHAGSAAGGGSGADQQPDSAAARGDSADGGEAGIRGVAAPPPAQHPTAGLPHFGSPSRGPSVDDGPFRRFALTVDVRTFQSSKRLPLSSANVYVQAVLPADLIELVVGSGFRLPSRLAPLRSHPAVDVPRGAEASLPNGYGTVEFSAGVVQLARVLASEPRIGVEAWHKERFRTDILLGAGSVPLTPLLQGAWVDGYAPLFAIVATSSGSGAAAGGEMREERVQMAMLRVVLSLEDKGPAPPPGSQAAAALQQPAAVSAHAESLAQRPSPYQPGDDSTYGAPGSATAAAATDAFAPALPAAEEEDAGFSIQEMRPPLPPPADGGAEAEPYEPGPSAARAVVPAAAAPPRQALPSSLPPAHRAAAPPAFSMPPLAAIAGASGASREAHGAGGGDASAAAALRGLPEFEAAWELEVWKKAEEARWRSELREREAQRMLVLESEWRRRERSREAELGSLRSEYVALEERALQALSTAEGRERRILAAEEALLRRRKELEREYSGRMTEAEAAVRRLQVECEHQLDIERDRNAELVRRVAMLEERLGASDARCLSVENEFADFRAASRSTPEAELARQLAEARETAKAADVRAAKASKAKQGYKEQVRKLAEQLASLQRRRQRDDDASFPRPTGLPASQAPVHGHGSAAIRAAAEEQARYAASQQQELATMRTQLAAIKAAALAQLSPGTSPRAERERAGMGGGGEAAAAGSGRAVHVDGGGGDGRAEDAAADLDLRRVDQQQRPGRQDWRPAPTASLDEAPARQHSAARGSGAGEHRADAAGSTAHGPAPLPSSDPASTPVHHPRPTAPDGSSAASNSSSRSSGASVTARDDPAARTHSQQQQQHHQQQPSLSGPTTAQYEHSEREGGGRGGGEAGPDGRWPQPRGSARTAAASAPSSSMAGAPRQPQQAQAAPYRGAHEEPAAAAPAASAPVAAASRHQAWGGRGDGGAGSPDWGPGSWERGDANVEAGPGPGSGRGRGVGSGGEERRRSLADHLASATSAAALTAVDRHPAGTQGGPAGAGGGSRRGWGSGAGGDGGSRGGGGRGWEDGPASVGSSWEHGGGGGAEATLRPQSSAPSRLPQPEQSGGSRGLRDVRADPDPDVDSDVSGSHVDLAEVQRLTRRKMELLQGGSYGLDHPVVQLLDERIQALMAATAGLPVEG